MRTKKEGKQREQIMNAFAALKKKNTEQNSEETPVKKTRKPRTPKVKEEVKEVEVKKPRKPRTPKVKEEVTTPTIKEKKENVINQLRKSKSKIKPITSIVQNEKIPTYANGMEKEIRTLNPVEQVFPEGCEFNKKPTVQGLLWLDKCLKCSNSCKIEALPKSTLVKCPDFKAVK
jgi:hypothetical protein